jgi:hypothetical protein
MKIAKEKMPYKLTIPYIYEMILYLAEENKHRKTHPKNVKIFIKSTTYTNNPYI